MPQSGTDERRLHCCFRCWKLHRLNGTGYRRNVGGTENDVEKFGHGFVEKESGTVVFHGTDQWNGGGGVCPTDGVCLTDFRYDDRGAAEAITGETPRIANDRCVHSIDR